VFTAAVGHRLVFAADEYYLLAHRPFPSDQAYEGFPMHEDGIGMARTFELEFRGTVHTPTGPERGFFAAVDAPAPLNPAAYTALRHDHAVAAPVRLRARRGAPIAVLTGELGFQVLAPLVDGLGRDDVRVLPVTNEFFGGNTAVTGLLVGSDLSRVLADQPEGHRYLLPDVCVNEGRFLDGTTVADLPRLVELVPTDGIALRQALEAA
jgi:NifB/MoaA-like Fe-S oxidoreductase